MPDGDLGTSGRQAVYEGKTGNLQAEEKGTHNGKIGSLPEKDKGVSQRKTGNLLGEDNWSTIGSQVVYKAKTAILSAEETKSSRGR